MRDYDKRDYSKIDTLPGGRDWRFFKTMAGPGSSGYPAREDQPNVYYAQMLRNVSFPKVVGSQALSAEGTGEFDYVFNLVAGEYIEEESIVLAFRDAGQWYTMDKVSGRREDRLAVGMWIGEFCPLLGSELEGRPPSVWCLHRTELSDVWGATPDLDDEDLLASRIYDLAWSPDGDLLAVCGSYSFSAGFVAVFDSAGSQQWFALRGILGGVAWDPEGNVVVRSEGGNAYHAKFDSNGNLLWERTDPRFSITALPGQALRIDGDGNIYSVGGMRFDADGEPLPDGPQHLNFAIDGARRLADCQGRFMRLYDESGQLQWEFDHDPNAKVAIAFCAAADHTMTRYAFGGTDQPFTPNTLRRNLRMFDGAGNELWNFLFNAQLGTGINSAEFRTVRGVAFDREANLYVCGDANRDLQNCELIDRGYIRNIVKLDPDGNVLVSRLLGGDRDTDPWRTTELLPWCVDVQPGKLREES